MITSLTQVQYEYFESGWQSIGNKQNPDPGEKGFMVQTHEWLHFGTQTVGYI